ncbi:MAG: heparinase II/III family protein [Planctomycetota bacterium]
MTHPFRVLLAVSLFFLPTAALAEPCTLYKAGDVANARENAARYQWAQGIVEGWKRNVRGVMEKDRGFIEEMIPELTPWSTYGQNCPVCVGEKSSMGECGIYRWNVGEPDKLVCKYCRTAYPNPDYPETGKLICPKMGQTFTYYETEAERAHPEDKSGKHAFRWVGWPVHTSFSGVIRTNKAGYVVGMVLPLTKLYAITGEVEYAERAGWIMDRLARVYPNYLFHSYNGTFADCPPAEAAKELGRNPRGGKFPKEVIVNAFGLHQTKDHAMLCNGFWGAGRYGCSGGDGGTILDMTVAYDLIHEAKHPDGTPMLAPETDQRIVNDLLLAGCADSENWSEINNKCGPGRALSAAVGILFERPESARWAFEGFRDLMDRCFHADGFCTESPSYSSMHLGLLRNIPEILRGYSDPPSYQPKEGERIENMQPFDQISRYRLALESMVRMMAPGRQYPVIGDTHYRGGLSTIWAEILADRYGPQYAGLLEEVQGKKLDEAGSEYALWYRDPNMKAQADAALPLHTEWFPGWHVAVLRAGEPEGDAAFYLNGYARHGHRHADTLGILHYAHGVELASDRGYIWDDPRNAWTASTLAHNIVAVDGTNQNVSDRRSRLELFGAAPGVEVVEASAEAYSQCDRYRRTCALVRLPDGGAYAVDFFRVRGGKLHQYSFNANGKLTALSTPEPQPIGEEIKWLGNLRAVEPGGPFTATWQHGETRIDLVMLSGVDRLIVADAPGWRSDSGSELNAPPIQQILAERRDEDGNTTSQYAALMVPYSSDESPVLAARLLANDLETGAMAVEVKLAGRTDTILSTLDAEEGQYGEIAFAGRFGFVSVNDEGAVRQGYLLAGTRLASGPLEITLPRATTPLEVKSVAGTTFQLAEPFPQDLKAEGLYLLAGDTGHEIQSAAGDSVIVRDYPATDASRITILHSAWGDAPRKPR